MKLRRCYEFFFFFFCGLIGYNDSNCVKDHKPCTKEDDDPTKFGPWLRSNVSSRRIVDINIKIIVECLVPKDNNNGWPTSSIHKYWMVEGLKKE